MKNSIGVIGKGFVGTAVVKGFANFSDVKIYDIDPKKWIILHNSSSLSKDYGIILDLFS